MQLTPRDWYSILTVKTSEVDLSNALGNALQVCGENPDRVALILAGGHAAADIIVNLTGASSLGKGVQIAAQTGTAPPLILSHEQHGKLVQMAWFATTDGGGFVSVYEVIMERTPEQVVGQGRVGH